MATHEQMLAALEVRFDSDAGDNLSIREYFGRLAEEVWREGEGFSGKRPFGNSGWESDVVVALVRGGFIKGKLDQDGYLVKCDKGATQYVGDLIRLAYREPFAPPTPA